ncbi:MAG: MFS transporter [Nitrospinota bacterium]|nr:MFS transporter [Nitrospinota bacterium]
MSKQNRWILLSVAWFVAINLRAGSIAVSPILPLIKAELALSYAQTGLLFAVPTILMAVFGLPGGMLADSLGMKRTITIGLTLILVGTALRAATSGFLALTIWTAVLGAGMGIANPGLTRMVKDRFPDMPGTATGIFTGGFIVGATAASWLTIPYLLSWTGSWRGTFLVWSGFALLALLGWQLIAKEGKTSGGGIPDLSGIWRDKTVWKLNIIFLSMNVSFYAIASWIPTYYQELGKSLEYGALILTIFLITGLPSCLVIPYLSDRFCERRWAFIISCLAFLPTVFGLMFFPLAAPILLATAMGIASAGIFALSFALPLYYVEPSKVGSVAGMNLLVGYGGSFIGPFALGLVHDLTGSFVAGWFIVVVILVVLIAVAWSLPKKTY